MARPRCALLALLLTACAGGEDAPESSGFASGPPATYSASAGSQSATSNPGASEASSEPMIRPDMGDTGGVTGGVATSTTNDPSDPSGDPTGVDPGTSTSTGPTGPVCGDGMIEAPEECEGADLAGKDCAMLGFTGGALACAANCIFDKSQCTSESCGDGTLNGGEECDCGQMGSPCSQAQLGNQACTNLVAPQNGNYHGGALACGSPGSCLFNKAGCTYCGDGVRNGPEACEGGDLGGASCQSLGFNGGGNLTCNANCTHNTAGCQNIVCGNGQCQPGEDSCSCPADCPDDPNSCSPCQCGGDGGNCFCDFACLDFFDCCPNGPC